MASTWDDITQDPRNQFQPSNFPHSHQQQQQQQQQDQPTIRFDSYAPFPMTDSKNTHSSSHSETGKNHQISTQQQQQQPQPHPHPHPNIHPQQQQQLQQLQQQQQQAQYTNITSSTASDTNALQQQHPFQQYEIQKQQQQQQQQPPPPPPQFYQHSFSYQPRYIQPSDAPAIAYFDQHTQPSITSNASSALPNSSQRGTDHYRYFKTQPPLQINKRVSSSFYPNTNTSTNRNTNTNTNQNQNQNQSWNEPSVPVLATHAPGSDSLPQEMPVGYPPMIPYPANYAPSMVGVRPYPYSVPAPLVQQPQMVQMAPLGTLRSVETSDGYSSMAGAYTAGLQSGSSMSNSNSNNSNIVKEESEDELNETSTYDNDTTSNEIKNEEQDSDVYYNQARVPNDNEDYHLYYDMASKMYTWKSAVESRDDVYKGVLIRHVEDKRKEKGKSEEEDEEEVEEDDGAGKTKKSVGRRLRSRDGCLTCRQRKKRCCEAKPVCRECERLNIKCRWPIPGSERKNKRKNSRDIISHDEMYHEEYGIIKILRGVVDYKTGDL